MQLGFLRREAAIFVEVRGRGAYAQPGDRRADRLSLKWNEEALGLGAGDAEEGTAPSLLAKKVAHHCAMKVRFGTAQYRVLAQTQVVAPLRQAMPPGRLVVSRNYAQARESEDVRRSSARMMENRPRTPSA
jgi:hypothetical protein